MLRLKGVLMMLSLFFCLCFTPYALRDACSHLFLSPLNSCVSSPCWIQMLAFCQHKVIRATCTATGLFSLTQGSSASKEAAARGWPFCASPTQLYLRAGSCVSLNPHVAAKLQAIAPTDELLQLCSATKLTKGQWSHTWQAAWLHDISCVVRSASVCMRLKEREKLLGVSAEFCWEIIIGLL